MRTGTALLLAVPLFLASFGAAYGVAAGRGEPPTRVDRALAAVQADRAHLVCPPEGDCLHPEAEYHAILFYRADDCSIGLYFLTQAQSLYGATDRATLNLLAVGGGTDPPDARLLARASGAAYPLYTRPDNVTRHFADPRPAASNKPVLVLADRHGRVLRTVEAAATVQGQRAQLDSVLTLVKEAADDR
jgi:hypothetical protein